MRQNVFVDEQFRCVHPVSTKMIPIIYSTLTTGRNTTKLFLLIAPDLHDTLPSLDETREEAGESSEPLLPDTQGNGEGVGRSHMRTKEHSIS